MIKPSPEITQTLSLNKEGFIENPKNWDTHFTELIEIFQIKKARDICKLAGLPRSLGMV